MGTPLSMQYGADARTSPPNEPTMSLTVVCWLTTKAGIRQRYSGVKVEAKWYNTFSKKWETTTATTGADGLAFFGTVSYGRTYDVYAYMPSGTQKESWAAGWIWGDWTIDFSEVEGQKGSEVPTPSPDLLSLITANGMLIVYAVVVVVGIALLVMALKWMSKKSKE